MHWKNSRWADHEIGKKHRKAVHRAQALQGGRVVVSWDVLAVVNPSTDRNQAAKQEKQESIESQELLDALNRLNLEVAESQLVRCNSWVNVSYKCGVFMVKISSLSMPELRKFSWNRILWIDFVRCLFWRKLFLASSLFLQEAAKALAAEAEKKTNAETLAEIQRDQRRIFCFFQTSQQSRPKHSCIDSD